MNHVGSSNNHWEDNLLKLVWEEMAQFFDVVKAKEFKRIEAKYRTSREVMYKVAEKVTEMDGYGQLKKDPPAQFSRIHISTFYLQNAGDCSSGNHGIGAFSARKVSPRRC